jgi:hypothetical protein
MARKKLKVNPGIQRQDQLIQQKMLVFARDRGTHWKTQEQLIEDFYQLVLQYTKSVARAANWRQQFRTLLLRGGSTQALIDKRSPLQGGKFSNK